MSRVVSELWNKWQKKSQRIFLVKKSNIFKNFLYFNFLKITKKHILNFLRFYKFHLKIMEREVLEYFIIHVVRVKNSCRKDIFSMFPKSVPICIKKNLRKFLALQILYRNPGKLYWGFLRNQDFFHQDYFYLMMFNISFQEFRQRKRRFSFRNSRSSRCVYYRTSCIYRTLLPPISRKAKRATN